ncbi:MAG: GNAT family N-acetyltransferase [Bacteroidota bacterium]
MATLPVLETERMVLEPLTWEHQAAIYEMDRDPAVMQYIGRAGRAKTQNEVADWIRRRMKGTQGLGTWSAFNKKDQTFSGAYLLVQLEESTHIEIGYRLPKHCWGKGLATEGATRILHYAFTDLHLPEVVAVAYPENRASRKVMEKLGLQYQKKDWYYQVEVVFYTLSKAQYLIQYQ